MRVNVKLGLLALAAGAICLFSGSCLFRYLGDLVGDVVLDRLVV